MLKFLKNKSIGALFAGVLTALGFELWWVTFIAFIVFAWLILTVEKPSKLGLFFGLGFFGVGIHWIYLSLYNYGGANFFFAVSANIFLILLLTIYPVLTLYVLQRFTVAKTFSRTLLFPCLWIVSELIRAYVINGFPWLSIGYSQLFSPLKTFAPLGGVWLLGLIFVLTTSLCAFFILTYNRKAIFTVFVLFLIGYSLNFVQWTHPVGEKFSVALIQGNVDQLIKFNPQKMNENFKKYLKLARKTSEKVIIFPETAITFFETTIADILKLVSDEFKERGQAILTGIPTGDLEQNEYFNSVIALGNASGHYQKHHLLPFGEYLPARKFLSLFRRYVNIPLGDFSRGSQKQTPLLTHRIPVGVTICFEAAFGREVINAFPEAQYLVNVSNDGWFKGSIAYDQHLYMNQMRALETGREMARATNTGLTAIIAADGTIKAVLKRDIEGILTGEIQPREGLTPYARFGNWLIFIILGCYVCAFSLKRMKV